jgi:hypothetical protein
MLASITSPPRHWMNQVTKKCMYNLRALFDRFAFLLALA